MLAKNNLVILIVTILIVMVVIEIMSYRKNIFKITAYCGCKICCGKWSGGPTKTGAKLRFGVCAVDPKVIPLNSIVTIEHLGTFRAEDIGGDIKGRCIDIYTPVHSDAVGFGVHHLKVKWRKSNEKK